MYYEADGTHDPFFVHQHVLAELILKAKKDWMYNFQMFRDTCT